MDQKTMRILIFTMSMGMGPNSVSKAIASAFSELSPAVDIKTIDTLDLDQYSLLKYCVDRKVKRMDMQTKNETMSLWERLIHQFDDIILKLSTWFSTKTYKAYLLSEPWDAIIHTNLHSFHFDRPRSTGRTLTPHFLIDTDFTTLFKGGASEADYFTTTTDLEANYLQSMNVQASRIMVTGIPISTDFKKPCVEEISADFGLQGDAPVIVLMSGGLGLGVMEQVFKSLLLMEMPANIIVVTGHNKELKGRLEEIKPAVDRHLVVIIGYTNKVHEIFSMADFIVSKPGGVTVAEALACGVPFVIANPLVGSKEPFNNDYLLENGAAVKIDHIETLPFKIGCLLSEGERMDSLKSRSLALAKPHAAKDVARFVCQVVASSNK